MVILRGQTGDEKGSPFKLTSQLIVVQQLLKAEVLSLNPKRCSLIIDENMEEEEKKSRRRRRRDEETDGGRYIEKLKNERRLSKNRY